MATADDLSETLGEFAKLKAWVKKSLDKHNGWYREAEESFDFVAGRQWSDDDSRAMTSTFRQPVVYNRVGVIVDSICGMEVNNRQDVKYLPRTQGDAQVNERLSSLADWARDECQAEDEESEAFRDNTICGRGWTETRMDFSEEPTGKIVIERVDPLQAGVDPGSIKANFADSRYRWRYKDLDIAEAEEMFPGILPQALNAAWAVNTDPTDGGEGNKRDYPDKTRDAMFNDERPKQARVVQIQWWDPSTSYMVAHPQLQEEPQEIDEETWLEQQQEMEGQGFVAAKLKKRVYYQAFLGQSDIIEKTEAKCFTLAAMTGKRDRNKGYHYGVVRATKDPQRVANKYLAQTMRIVDTNAKGGLLAEKGVFSDPKQAERDWSDPTKIIYMNDGALSSKKVQPRESPGPPQAMQGLIEMAIGSIRDVVGTNVELLGAADRDQAASLELQRRQSAITILAPLFDSLRRYRKTQGSIMIEHLRMLPPGVLVRVVNEEDMPEQEAQPGQPQPKKADNQFTQFDPAAFGLDDEQARFDIIVDEAPTSPNQKEATWNALQPFMAGLAQNPKAVAVALKYSPLPLAAAQELGEAMNSNGLPPEVQAMIQKGQEMIQQLTQENNQLKGDQSAKQATAQAAVIKATTDRDHKLGKQEDQMPEWFKLQMDMQRDEAARQFEAQQAGIDRQFTLLQDAMKSLTQIETARISATAGAGDPGAEDEARERIGGA